MPDPERAVPEQPEQPEQPDERSEQPDDPTDDSTEDSAEDPDTPDMPDETDETDETDEEPGEPTATATATSGRGRLLDALMHPRRGQVLAAVLLALVGFAGVTQVRTNVDDSTYAGSREQDLIDILSGLAGTTQRAQSQLEDLQRTKTQLDSDSSKRQAALQQAQTQAGTLSVLAGLVPVTGPGIKITITEQTGEVKVGSFLDLIEELRTNGAEAIDVNGKVRLVAESSFEQGVGGLIIDGELVSSPYVVTAIGEPATLESAVVFGRGPKSEFTDDGADVDVSQEQSLEIRSVRTPDGDATP